jgi:hypothetical protein
MSVALLKWIAGEPLRLSTGSMVQSLGGKLCGFKKQGNDDV